MEERLDNASSKKRKFCGSSYPERDIHDPGGNGHLKRRGRDRRFPGMGRSLRAAWRPDVGWAAAVAAKQQSLAEAGAQAEGGRREGTARGQAPACWPVRGFGGPPGRL